MELDRRHFAADQAIPLKDIQAQAQQFARIHQTLIRLPERYQTVLALRHFESLSYEDVADVLGTKVGTVKSLIHRGLERLKKEYAANGATLSPALNDLARRE